MVITLVKRFLLVLKGQIIYKSALLPFFTIDFLQDKVYQKDDLKFKLYYRMARGFPNKQLIKKLNIVLARKDGSFWKSTLQKQKGKEIRLWRIKYNLSRCEFFCNINIPFSVIWESKKNNLNFFIDFFESFPGSQLIERWCC